MTLSQTTSAQGDRSHEFFWRFPLDKNEADTLLSEEMLTHAESTPGSGRAFRLRQGSASHHKRKEGGTEWTLTLVVTVRVLGTP